MKRLFYCGLLCAALTVFPEAGQSAPDSPSKSGDSEGATTPKPRHKKKSPAKKDEDSPSSTPAPTHHADPDADATASGTKSKKPDVDGEEKAGSAKAGASIHAPAATIETTQLRDYSTYPAAVQRVISAALDLTKLNLTYTYGSAEPSSGGMDCSGTIYYLLRSQGFKDVPRDSSEQYIWARQHGQFFAVISVEADGFEFKDLQPGDLMFWSGTYKTERTVPITHVMLYLGREKDSGKRVMFGSSDGRSYNGVQRWGVSVFDFKMPKVDPANPEKHANFVGYAHIPALRESPPPAPVVASRSTPVPQATPPPPAPPVPASTPAPRESAPVAAIPSDALREPQRGSPERKAIMDALRAEKYPGQSSTVIFQVNYLKVHNGWAWTDVTPQKTSGTPIDKRFPALLHFEDGQWKSMDIEKVPAQSATLSGKEVDTAFTKSLQEAFPTVPADILPVRRKRG